MSFLRRSRKPKVTKQRVLDALSADRWLTAQQILEELELEYDRRWDLTKILTGLAKTGQIKSQCSTYYDTLGSPICLDRYQLLSNTNHAA